MTSQQDPPDALAQRSPRERNKPGGDTSVNTIWEREEKAVFVTAGMGYTRARGLAYTWGKGERVQR
ncbi:hypothetical protein [Ktedonobacter racemifer]|uniref:Uncharacterized protein n=1 Tax=Ktedonobacter racemifer DSM 44963 TaxID=485913 RepID=D6TBR5_KTERA|nr:hypothetical protein [Ktedonobacter racemifer]EFH89847.1 hypothetical protein Krac_11429 [Ktedonobacter racemifer DSM 44963]